MAFRTVDGLIAAGLLPEMQRGELEVVAAAYAVAVTPAMASLMEPHNVLDPIGRQFLPRREELDVTEDERADPIGDAAFSPVPGIVHRYPDRVLLKPTHTCPVYCRFCFRREVVGPDGAGNMTSAELDQALAYIAANPSIWEVILTGGDPLVLSPRRLKEIVQAVDAIQHVRVIRIHTRVPAVDPSRVDADLLQALTAETNVYVALHANHPRELTVAARAACHRIINAGISMLSQTVLLRGVNDDVETLANLMRAFVEMRIRPYYLHHPDLARGTGHFRLSIAEGQALVRALRGRLSGLCQPTYVLDIPGGFGKSPIGPNYVIATGEANEEALVEDYQGQIHTYSAAAKA
jgi:lysine 2,3-aminomutase